MQHEYGHVLQYRIVGEKAYYSVIAKESMENFICDKIYKTSTHDTFWTETWANYLAKNYFGARWYGLNYKSCGPYRYFPVKDISQSLKKLKFGSFGIF